MKISIIAAIDERGAIGYQGDLLYHLKEDLQRFKKLTMGHCIIMGRKTFESLPNGPLPGRTNIVLTSDDSYGDAHGVLTSRELATALLYAHRVLHETECFVIGGGSVYELAVTAANKMYITLIHANDKPADTYFPLKPGTKEWERVIEKCSITKSATHDNVEYLDIITRHSERF